MKANIDNKNILEDFTDIFHQDVYIERICNKITYQVFYLCGCLCEVSYRFGQNWFKVRIIEGNPDDVRRCSYEISSITKEMNQDYTDVSYNPVLGVYEFNFVES